LVERHHSLLALLELLSAAVECFQTCTVTALLLLPGTPLALWIAWGVLQLYGGTDYIAEHFAALMLAVTTLLQSKSINLLLCHGEVDRLVSVLQESW
jgi:hypothetical protein